MEASFYDANNATHNSSMGGGGERVRVAMRLRPMMPHETSRKDGTVVSVANQTHVHLNLKTGAKQFRFNAVLNQDCTQLDVFGKCGVSEMIDSALEGYATTIFAYG